MGKKTKIEKSSLERPNIYAFHDYREFLRQWFFFLSKNGTGFTLRRLSREMGIAAGYLPMVLSGRRNLSHSVLQKLKRPSKLTAPEFKYLSLLWRLAESDDPTLRRQTLRQLRASAKQNGPVPPVLNSYQYLTQWYFVAIRELANQPGFRAEPKWIKDQLQFPVSLKEVSEALTFLLRESYLVEREDGSVVPSEKNIDCLGGVYRIALADFHRQMLKLTEASFATVPSTERHILGHTLSLSERDYQRVCDLFRELLLEVSDADSSVKSDDRVYHITLAALPLTKKGK